MIKESKNIFSPKIIGNELVNLTSETKYNKAPIITTTTHEEKISNLTKSFEDSIQKTNVKNIICGKIKTETFEPDTTIEKNIYDITAAYLVKNTMINPSTALTLNFKIKSIFAEKYTLHHAPTIRRPS